MKLAIVSCFSGQRNEMIYDWCKARGMDAALISSDFDHITKRKITDKNAEFIYIKTQPYYKNMSLQRILSHRAFARDAFDYIETLAPNLIYVSVPPNFMAHYAAKYKRKHPQTKIYFDLIDLWPESFPVGNIKNYPPFTFWRRLRDANLNIADKVVTECGLYQERLAGVVDKSKMQILYMARHDSGIKIATQLDEQRIQLCYLGSINSIIDIDTIAALIRGVAKYKPVVLHIIGDGESREQLIESAKNAGADVKFYGKVFDEQKKHEIFSRCHFGLNIMKDTVCVGLTIKSIDYFEAELPIINTIRGDTTRLVDERGIGWNITANSGETVWQKIAGTDAEQHAKMSHAVRVMFEELFSHNAFNRTLDKIFGSIA